VSSGIAVLSFFAFVVLAFFFDLDVFFSIGTGAASWGARESKLALRLLSLFLRWEVEKCIVAVEEGENGRDVGVAQTIPVSRIVQSITRCMMVGARETLGAIERARCQSIYDEYSNRQVLETKQ
jgi:hypothetical protein